MDTDKLARKCGDCTLCCRVLPMEQRPQGERLETLVAMIKAGWATASEFDNMLPDFAKPAGEMCPHQSHKGCKVYSRRPLPCRYWNCRWLTGDDTADLRRPDRSHVVVDIMPDFITLTEGDGEPINVEVVQLWVDPKHPDAWRDDPALMEYLNRRGGEGKAALIRNGPSAALTVLPPAMNADKQWHIVSTGKVRGTTLRAARRSTAAASRG